MEFVDVIDENGNVLDSVLKQAAHEKGLSHKCVVAEVIDSQGRMLLVRQAQDRQDAGQYVSPVGGHVAAGEKDEDALKRETEEELGLKDFTLKQIGKTIFNREILGRKENHTFVLYEIYSDQEPVINHESVEFEWFTKEELRNRLRNNPKEFGDAFFVVLKNFYPELLE